MGGGAEVGGGSFLPGWSSLIPTGCNGDAIREGVACRYTRIYNIAQRFNQCVASTG